MLRYFPSIGIIEPRLLRFDSMQGERGQGVGGGGYVVLSDYTSYVTEALFLHFRSCGLIEDIFSIADTAMELFVEDEMEHVRMMLILSMIQSLTEGIASVTLFEETKEIQFRSGSCQSTTLWPKYLFTSVCPSFNGKFCEKSRSHCLLRSITTTDH